MIGSTTSIARGRTAITTMTVGVGIVEPLSYLRYWRKNTLATTTTTSRRMAVVSCEKSNNTSRSSNNCQWKKNHHDRKQLYLFDERIRCFTTTTSPPMTTRTKTTTSTNEQSTIIGSTNNGISINGTIPLNGKGIEIGNYAMVSIMDTYSCTVVFVFGVNEEKKTDILISFCILYVIVIKLHYLWVYFWYAYSSNEHLQNKILIRIVT